MWSFLVKERSMYVSESARNVPGKKEDMSSRVKRLL